MPAYSKSNVPQDEPLKWNLRKAATEFSTTVDTLTKALNRISEGPDENGLFTTAQLIQAQFGQLHVEKVRYQRALAERVELENSVAKANLLDRASIMQGLAALADALVSAVKTSNLDRPSQETFLQNLATWPVVVKDVADRQTKRRPRRSNGETEKDESEG
jgi:hypothetical protein